MSFRAQARRSALSILSSPLVTQNGLRRLRSKLNTKDFDGRLCHACFIGILGGETREGYEKIWLSVSGGPDSDLLPIEYYCMPVTPFTPLTSRRRQTMINWVDHELDRRKRVSGAIEELIAETPARPGLEGVNPISDVEVEILIADLHSREAYSC